MGKHTPTPWELCDDGGRYLCLNILGLEHPICKVYQGEWGDTYPALRHIGNGSLDQRWEPYIEMITYGEIPKETAIANAAFIVKAVNSHEALVAALKDAISNCKECDGVGIAYTMEDETTIGQAPGSSGIKCPECSMWRSALALAGEDV